MNKKIDIKTILIIVLTLLLVIGVVFHKNKVNNSDSFEKITIENKGLLLKVDSLTKINAELDKNIMVINLKIDSTNKTLKETELELTKLNKRKNEIPRYINSLSANDVSSSLTEFIEKSKN